MQRFRLILAGGVAAEAHLPQEQPVSAQDFWAYLKGSRTNEDGLTVVDDALCFDARALIGVERIVEAV